jgi:hypothetical protein
VADINVERKGPSIWPWIIGLIILALLIWALVELLGGEEEAAVAPVAEPVVTEVQPTVPPVNTPEPIAQAEGVPVSQIIESPATWTGQTVGGEVTVSDVPTDRGFWIEDQGERLFVVLNDAPSEQPVNINPGQTVRLREAVIYDNAANVPNELDPDTRSIVEGQPVFLAVDEENIEMMQGAGNL